MQSQKIITENGNDFLVVAMPTIPELFSYGFVSSTGKSFVYRKYTPDKKVMLAYMNFKLNPSLIRGRIINSHNHFHSKDFETHEFNGLGILCVKISVSKILKPT